jgi:hypothetical protein
LDDDVKVVLEFMQEKIPASKLVGVAERMPQIAKLLWDRYPQEAVTALSLSSLPLSVSSASEIPPSATV